MASQPVGRSVSQSASRATTSLSVSQWVSQSDSRVIQPVNRQSGQSVCRLDSQPVSRQLDSPTTVLFIDQIEASVSPHAFELLKIGAFKSPPPSPAAKLARKLTKADPLSLNSSFETRVLRYKDLTLAVQMPHLSRARFKFPPPGTDDSQMPVGCPGEIL